jgi:hypothetical protein
MLAKPAGICAENKLLPAPIIITCRSGFSSDPEDAMTGKPELRALTAETCSIDLIINPL